MDDAGERILRQPRVNHFEINELLRMVDFAPIILDPSVLSGKGVSMDDVGLKRLVEGRKRLPST